MMRRLVVPLVLVVSSLSSFAQAADCCFPWFWNDPLLRHPRGCVDDYCGKPMPCPPRPTPCLGKNDYCGKCEPNVCKVPWTGCNDYCPKPCPPHPPLTGCCPPLNCGCR